MKRPMLIVAVLVAAVCAYAQKVGAVLSDGFSVEVFGFTAINEDDLDCHPYGVGLSDGYQWYIVKGLYLQPSASIYYKKRATDNYRLLGDAPKPYKHNEFRYGLNIMAGYSFPVASSNSLSIFTGYQYTYAFHVEEKLGGFKWNTHEGSIRLQPYWLLGVQFNLKKHYYANASVDFGMKNLDVPSKSYHENLFRLGFGYKF